VGVPTNKLQAISGEVEAQPRSLDEFMGLRIRRARPESIFVGAGDSYACALAVQYLSRGRSLAVDPYVLLESPDIASGREVYFISVSGRTRSNIAAAKAVKAIALSTTAITANPGSPLSKATRATIEIPYPYSPRTPGTLSFTLSLLAAIKLACGPFRCGFARLLSQARASSKMAFSRRGTTYFLGNGPAHSIALYAALKMFELFGDKADAELLEEFGHANLFSLRPSDAVNIFTAYDPAGIGRKLVSALGREGYVRNLIPSEGRNEFESIFFAAFFVQTAILKEARSRGVAAPYIARSKKKLKLSDSMIY
jgi:fructoselysine-6-P-deglycase FrlB-like protein